MNNQLSDQRRVIGEGCGHKHSVFCFLIGTGKVDGRNIKEYFDSATSNHTSTPAEVIPKVAPNKDIWSVVAVRLENLPDIIQYRSPNPNGTSRLAAASFLSIPAH